MVATPTVEAQRSASPASQKPRDSRGRIVALETLDLQDLESKPLASLDGKGWSEKHVKALMRASVRLCAVAVPQTLERLLLYEKVMMSHLERGMLLFGLGKHAGKNVLVLCVDGTTAERIAKRAPASVDAGQPAQVAQAQVAPNVDLHLSAQVAVDVPAQVDVSTKPTPQVAQVTTAQAGVDLHQAT